MKQFNLKGEESIYELKSECHKAEVFEDFIENPRDHHDPTPVYRCHECLGVCNVVEVCKYCFSKKDGEEDLKTKIMKNIGFLRQWLNENRITDLKKMVNNRDIEYMLFNIK